MANGPTVFLAIALSAACGDDQRKSVRADALFPPGDGADVGDGAVDDGSTLDAPGDAVAFDASALFMCDSPADCGTQTCCYTTTPVQATTCRNNCQGAVVCVDDNDCGGTTIHCCLTGAGPLACMASCTLF